MNLIPKSIEEIIKKTSNDSIFMEIKTRDKFLEKLGNQKKETKSLNREELLKNIKLSGESICRRKNFFSENNGSLDVGVNIM